MSKFHKDEEDPIEYIYPPEKAHGAAITPEVKRYFEKVLWRGIVPVYKCLTCGHCENLKDDIILHVVTHEPEKERAKLFEKLIKEY
jgi:hypothetical protein